MPNHITNVLRLTSYDAPGLIDVVVEAVNGGEQPFDFNRLIPKPTDLDIVSGSQTDAAHALFDDEKAIPMLRWPWVRSAGVTDLPGLRDLLRKKYLDHPQDGFPSLDALAERVGSNLRRYGKTDWYAWSVQQWGTKWNAYSCVGGKIDEHEAVFHFETAWSPPMPVISELARRFPKLTIRLIWCDEGSDHASRVYWRNGALEST